MSHQLWQCSNSGSSLVSSYVARNTSCAVRSVSGVWIPDGNAAGVVYIHVYDGYVLPANGSVPITQISICYAANTNPFNFSFDFHEVGLYCANGFVIASSSTCPTLTLDGARMFVSAMTRI